VDAQLMEQGAFSPLDLLFNSGRLIYSDYEAWRRREIESLDSVLMGDGAKIAAETQRAVDYARSIGLVEQPQEFLAWDEAGAGSSATSGKSLRVSGDPRFARLIGSRYVPAQKVPQMDLFFDNPVVALANGITRALTSRNLGESQRQLDRLYMQSPNHPDLAAYDQLLAALEGLDQPVTDVQARVAFLLQIAPSARHLLGMDSRDFLAPLWRQVADHLGGVGFSAAAPELHRSFALGQAQDWLAVGESVLGEAQWWEQPVLCLRLADSSFRRRRRVEGLTAWCHFCWRAPEQVAAGVERLRQVELGALWRRFQEWEEEVLEQEVLGGGPTSASGGGKAGAGMGVADVPGADASVTAVSAADFPAWLLLQEQGLARQLDADLPTGDTAAEHHYKWVHRWIHAHRAHLEAEEIALRKSLRAGHPALFEVLKKSVGR
jgi:hypothetical protein